MLDQPAMASETLPLLLLPGTLADDTVFAPVLERLGMTSTWMRMAGATSATEMARIILAAAPQRFTLIGFSLGAIMSLEVVAQAPERVERLALLGCNARDLTSEKAAARRATVPIAERLGLTSYIDGVWQTSVPAHRRNDQELRAQLHQMATDTPMDAFRDQIEMAIDRVDSRPRLELLDMPVLVACGAEDGICPPELSAEIAGAIPGATLAIVEAAGHYLTLDQPDEVARLLREWLTQPTRTSRLAKEFS
ncbi:alpha/beta fold hydrolase [Devosia sp.]|uniref:alpha/beta fold hydrolase n=1 Tax=Devosia sp. TaxID=1871048 RepID=UPI003BAA0D97